MRERKVEKERKERILFVSVAKWFAYYHGNIHNLATAYWYQADMEQ